MTTKFRKGELVVMQHATYFTEYDGCLGVVQTGLIQTTATDMRDMKEKIKWGYDVKVLHPGIQKTVIALPHQLRRLRDNPGGQFGDRSKDKPKPVNEVTP